MQIDRLVQLARDILDPERFGFAVSREVHVAARAALKEYISSMPPAPDQPSEATGAGFMRETAGGTTIKHIKLGGES